MTNCLRIVIVDDHPLFRAGVVETLRRVEVTSVIGEGKSAQDAVRIVREESPDIVLLDVSIPGGGIEAARSIAEACPAARVIMLTVSESEHDVAEALRAGAKGYILKGTSASEFVKAVLAVGSGECYVTPGLAARLLTHAKREEHSPATDGLGLTPREVQILEEVARGLSNKEVARKLTIAEKTVKHHMTVIMQKLQVRNRVEAALAFRKPLSRHPQAIALH